MCIHIMSMLKAVHSPRRAVDFVRISFEKLTTPRLKWLAALVKFQDGKEFEPKGNAFQVKGALSNAATLASLNRRPQCVSVFMSGSPHLGDVRSMTLRKSCAQKRVAFALLLDCTWYLSSLLAASGNREEGETHHRSIQDRRIQPEGGLFMSNALPPCAASQLDGLQDGRWETEEMMSVSLRHDTTEPSTWFR